MLIQIEEGNHFVLIEELRPGVKEYLFNKVIKVWYMALPFSTRKWLSWFFEIHGSSFEEKF